MIARPFKASKRPFLQIPWDLQLELRKLNARLHLHDLCNKKSKPQIPLSLGAFKYVPRIGKVPKKPTISFKQVQGDLPAVWCKVDQVLGADGEIQLTPPRRSAVFVVPGSLKTKGFWNLWQTAPGPPKVCFMKVFRYIKPTKKHSLGGPGRKSFSSSRFESTFARIRFEKYPKLFGCLADLSNTSI